MSDAFSEILNAYKYEALLQIAAGCSLISAGHRLRPPKEALLESLTSRLATSEHVSQALSELSPLERAVLDRLLLHPGKVPTTVLRDELQREDVIQPGPRKAAPPRTDGAAPPRPDGAASPRTDGAASPRTDGAAPPRTDGAAPPRTDGAASPRPDGAAAELYEGSAFDPERNDLEDVLARLTLHGLVFSSGHPAPWTGSVRLGLSPGQTLVVPEPLRALLPRPPLPPVEWGRGNLPAPMEASSTDAAQRDLFIYWSCVRAQPSPLTQAGLLQRRTLRTINEQLLAPDPSAVNASVETDAPRLYFMRLLLQDLGLLAIEHGHLHSTGSRSRVPDIWRLSSAQRSKTCVQVWLRMRRWSELASLNVSTVSFDLPQARVVLLEQLRLLTPGVWVSAERFLHRLAIIAPRLLFQARDPAAHNSTPPASAYYAEANHATRQSHWFAEIEAAFVGGALSGPLHWLGLLDVSADEGRLLAFRINPDGARALGLEPALPDNAPASTGDARVIVLPNFRILALGPVSEATLAQLEMLADRVNVDRSAFEYVLSRETVYRAQKDGLSVPTIVAFLQQASDTAPPRADGAAPPRADGAAPPRADGAAPPRADGAALPQNVLRTLEEWGEQHERIVFHRGVTLCQAAGPDVMERLWGAASLLKHFERALTPTVALVRRGRATAFQEALLQQGWMPAFSPRDDDCAGRVVLTGAGELQPVHAGPDLLLEACLRDLSEERDGRRYVTQGAVETATRAGLSVPEYLHRLALLHHGPLPDAWRTRIKAWGHYYGPATLRKAVLLEVKDAATADELLADPLLAPLLARLPSEPHGKTLVVRTEDLDSLRRLLGDHGVDVG